MFQGIYKLVTKEELDEYRLAKTAVFQKVGAGQYNGTAILFAESLDGYSVMSQWLCLLHTWGQQYKEQLLFIRIIITFFFFVIIISMAFSPHLL